MQYSILLTNDDGIQDPGLHILYDAIKDLGTIHVIVPEKPRSAMGCSLTLHKPLRIRKVRSPIGEAYLVSGNPVDVLILALFKILKSKPDIVVSGLNFGENTSLQVILASGTVASVIHSALLGIPAIAFSIDVYDVSELSEETLKTVKKICKLIVEWVLNNGMPDGADILNVNFPRKVDKNTPIKVTKLAKLRYKQHVEERVDPRGRPYYWITGILLERLEEGTDAYAISKERVVSLTPLKVEFKHVIGSDVSRMLEYIRHNI